MRPYQLSVLGCFFLIACSSINSATSLPPDASYGANPILPKPDSTLIPTVNIAPAKGWSPNSTPTPALGLKVQLFAAQLKHPRWLYVLPNGDVLVAETDAPPKPEDSKGIKGKIMMLFMKRAGSSHTSANQITLLSDHNQDGIADERTVFLSQLNSPFGMVLIGNWFYVANTDALWRFPYHSGDKVIQSKGMKILDLPAGELNHHWTKNIIASKDGRTLYITIGSNSNVGENGLDKEQNRAQIWAFDIASGRTQTFATGIRNPNGMAWQPQSNQLWTVVNERDELGNDLVPDYLTSVKQGGFYGWPYSYFGQHIDQRVKPQRPDLVAKAIAPDYALGAHTASLGLAFYSGTLLPQYSNGAIIGQHGSWNRKPHSGYKVVYVPFNEGQPAGLPQDILSGFLNQKGEAQGRPVGVAVDGSGAILVADDVGNAIWRVSPL